MSEVAPRFDVQFFKGRWIQGDSIGSLLNVSVRLDTETIPRFSHYGSQELETAIADSKPLTKYQAPGHKSDRLSRYTAEEMTEEVFRCSFSWSGAYPNIMNRIAGTIDFVFVDEIETVTLNPFEDLGSQTNANAQSRLLFSEIEVVDGRISFKAQHDFEFVSDCRAIDPNGKLLKLLWGEGRNKSVYSLSLYGFNAMPNDLRIEFDLPQKREITSIPFSFEEVPIGLA